MRPYPCLLEATRKAAVAHRIGIVSEDRQASAPSKGGRLSYRASILINLVASAAMYGFGYLVLRAIIRLL